MKPLLSAPWTKEDEAIAFRHGFGNGATMLRASTLQADIRDAALMLSLTKPGRSIWCIACPAGPYSCGARGQWCQIRNVT